MIYDPSWIAVFVFLAFVVVTVGLSFFLGRKATSSEGYFAAHGQIPWFINGVAFAGDYLSAASFLGICGMIAAYGYDGFLYSIGYLAGWIVALFVIAEPMKRLGRFTFADALDAQFNSRGIKLAAGISTLAVSIFYLIPQMVGAGSLIQPLLGFPHWVGVVMVGVVVIVIVVTAGMVSTTWVQFLKGSLLVFFSAILVVMLLRQGFVESDGGLQSIGPIDSATVSAPQIEGRDTIPATDAWAEHPEFVRLANSEGGFTIFRVEASAENPNQVMLRQAQAISTSVNGEQFVDGLPFGASEGQRQLLPIGHISKLPSDYEASTPLGPISFFTTLSKSEIVLWGNEVIRHPDGATTKVYFQKPTAGTQVLRPGEHPMFSGIRGGQPTDRINFLSLMLALFCGTASLPHILIRYYTVKDGSAARKSTIVGIASIGFFYVLTLYLGLGAMTSNALDLTDTNMAAPLLARSISQWLFAIISAIAFTTVLGTVSGLILASSGAVAHDLIGGVLGIELSGHTQVRVAKLAAVFVGLIAILLGIAFKEMNVSYLVGWAFSVAASANLPALVMLLFWKRTTKEGIISSVIVGMLSSLGWILLSADTYEKVFGWDGADAIVPFAQPGIVTIPLAFVALVVVSLLTKRETPEASHA
ncbi:Cation/acetate symporter ActP [Novipirellula galeiformis]|uniref:Cation/acetate symporter ActP n=1 Tax=Novipirellula galeiformis TaxID=2528004 RepID=A0A5C6CFM2_9BACT|nr:cation acetate symporter [Novipirellula galeiformis]TWU22942.1 Cation/acetate symporter ActP [Novipirellula galeiformis]